MKYLFLLALVFAQGCASTPQEIRRLSPLPGPLSTPKDCVLIGVLAGSPAANAGLQNGDRIQSIDGQLPADANAVAPLIDRASVDSQFFVVPSSGTGHLVTVRLNAQKPRLGAACDLTGVQKPGFTAAGNESLTVFNGPLALTISGILDKGIAFVRVHFSNDADHAVLLDPQFFSRESGNAPALPALSPLGVMCLLYGDKGLRLLALRRQQTQTLEATSLTTSKKTCPSGQTEGREAYASDVEVKANAEYVSNESLWPSSVLPNQAAEGLVYFPEPPALPMTVSATIDNRLMSVSLGDAQPQQDLMKESDRIAFFESLKKGTPVRLTTKKGKVFVGKFIRYDAIDEKAWFEEPNGGLLSSVNYPITSIRYASKVNN